MALSMSCCEALFPVENSPIPNGSSVVPPTEFFPFVLDEKNGDAPKTSGDAPLLVFPLLPFMFEG